MNRHQRYSLVSFCGMVIVPLFVTPIHLVFFTRYGLLLEYNALVAVIGTIILLGLDVLFLSVIVAGIMCFADLMGGTVYGRDKETE